jgi:hypothetical protein
MAQGLILAFDSETPPLYDGGDRPFSVSNLASVGQAVVGVLRHFDETRNRVLYVPDLVITQNKVLSIPEVGTREEVEPRSCEHSRSGGKIAG